MSLFTFEEVCRGCKNAVFHECCNKFCRCRKGHETEVNHYQGVCTWYVEVERAELGIDGNCGYALLGTNIQDGEVEFVEIPAAKLDADSSFMRPKGEEAAKLWACKEALRKLRARLNMPNMSYFFDKSHPYGS